MSIMAAFSVPHPPMIVPEVGRGSEEQIKKTTDSYLKIAEEIAALKPDTIIISSPHTVMYGDFFHISPGERAEGSFSGFAAPGIVFSEEYDCELVQRIESIAYDEKVPCGTLGERDRDLDHGTMVPLYFIRQKYDGFKLVRIGLSGNPLTDHYAVGRVIKRACEELGRNAVYIASGDLSHKLQEYGPYGFAKEGPEYDKRVMDVLGRAAFDELFDFDESFCEKAAECGHRSFVMMAGALDGIKVNAKSYSYEDVTGVGYGICSFYPLKDDNRNIVNDDERKFLDMRLDDEKKRIAESFDRSDVYVKLAGKTLEEYIRTGKEPDLNRILARFTDNEINELTSLKAAVFVSIHKHGALRGCIGTIFPTTDCVAKEIIQNAISASTRDPRFEPVGEEEIPFLEINVDVLSEPEAIESEDELDVKKYGVIVTSGYKRGLLLPDLDGVDTVEDQVAIAMQKGGITRSDKYKLERFEVIRHR